MWHHQYLPQGGCPPRICPPPQQYRDPGHLPPQQQYAVSQDYPPRIHPPPQQYGAPRHPPPQQQYSSPQGGHPPQGFTLRQQHVTLVHLPPQQYAVPQDYPPRIHPPPQQYDAPSYTPPRQQYGAPQGDYSPQGFTLRQQHATLVHLPPQQYAVPQDYPPRIHPPPQQYSAPSYPPPRQQYAAPQGDYSPQAFTLPQQQQYSAPQGGYPPQGLPLPQQYGTPGYPPPQQQYGAPQGYPPQQQQFSPPPGQYPPQQHSYSAPPPGQYGSLSLGPLPGQYGAPPLGQYGAPLLQHYGIGPPANHIQQVESLATSRVESEDVMSTSTHDSSPPSETTDPSCYWCSRISLRDDQSKPWPDERTWLQELFHSDCECRRRENASPSSACGFCNHLDFRHLFHSAPSYNSSGFPTIFSDWYCRENPHNGCQLCEYMASYGTSESGIGLEIYKIGGDCFFTLWEANEPRVEIRLSQDPVSQLQEYVNWEQIKEWTSELDSEEGTLPVDFRVIDVERNCIVAPDNPVDYVALSYVWGDSAQKEKPFQASMRNIKDLGIEGSLSGAPLPRTITDAMEVCRQLNQKYLWVDRLCIIQDHESKHGQIQRMDSIFKSSNYTIIALSGRDANDGLAGVSKPRKSHRLKILEWQGISLTNIFPDITELVETSYWGKRGWTFQEEFCSRNNLYFTEYGVYQCEHESRLNTECLAEDHEKGLFFNFPDSVEAYATRSFTDPGDLLRALTGVLNIKYGGRHQFGNAATDQYSGHEDSFSAWIHWQPVDWEYEARRPPKDVSMKPVSHIQPHKSGIFPSWSWTSAQGGVRFDTDARPVALWAFPVDQESQEDSNVEWVSDDCDADDLREMTVKGGLMSVEEFPVQLGHDRRLISAPSTLFEKADRDEACKKLGRVLSFSQIASLRLECFDNHFCDGRRTFRIISSSGRCIGGIFLPKLSLEYISNRDGGRRDKEFEFIALSTCLWWDSNKDIKRILKGVGLKKRKGQEMLNVMLIWQAKDSNVSRRLGIGNVYQDKWLKERPVLKTIILE